MNHTTIPEYLVIAIPEVEWEPPQRNILPDEVEEEGLEDDWGYGELNFDDEV